MVLATQPENCNFIIKRVHWMGGEMAEATERRETGGRHIKQYVSRLEGTMGKGCLTEWLIN